MPMSTRDPDEVIAAAVSLRGCTVVDVGSGEGQLARKLLGYGAARVIGVECSAEMRRLAVSSADSSALEFVDGVGQAMPLSDGIADVVVFSNSLHHVPVDRQGQALLEARRVAKRSGVIIVLEPIAPGPYQDLLAPVHDETEVRAHAQREIAMAVERGVFSREAGFEFRKVSHYASFEAFRERILRINPDRADAVVAVGERWRQAFQRVGRRHERGWSFDTPIRVDVLRVTSARSD